jgi:hypothetical protein
MKSIEKFFEMPMGAYCGVFLREKMAKKLAKLLYKQNQEIKELLASDLSQLEVSDWTLSYPDEEKQFVVKYYMNSSDQDKLFRINLIDRTKLIDYCEDGVFEAVDNKDAQKQFIEWYENTKITKLLKSYFYFRSKL